MNSFIKSYLLVSLVAIASFNTAEAQSDKAKKTTKSTKVVKTVPVKYTVNGRIEDMPNHFVVLNEFVANSLKVIDSCYTDTAGKFVFKGTIENEKIMYLQYSKNGFIPLVITKDMNTNLLILPYTTGLNYELSGTGFEKSHEIKNFLVNQTQYSKAVGDIEGVFNSGAELSEDQKYALEQQYYQARDVSTNHIKESILNSKSGLTSYFILLNFVEEPEFPEIEAIYKKLLVENPNSAYFKEIKLKYDIEAPTAIGAMAPDISSMVTPEGKVVKLSSLKGKYVMIDFWASWCGPCRRENPNNKLIYEKYKSKGFEIYAVSLDKDAASWKQAITADGLPWIHVSDLKYWQSAAAQLYRVYSIPATVILDKKGKIIAKNLRGQELDDFLAKTIQ